ncbi:hypothetical protein [Ruegeria profundi]|uniref:hypothetical protein n=1 Tax=Ruegeria profundi TaxID=1685378 RepID=UPI003C7B4E71
MMDTNILDMLDNIGRSSVARLSPAVPVEGETSVARRAGVLRAIRGTVLPRRLEFTAANGDVLAIEVSNARVTDVFRVRSGMVPDFETEPREGLIGKLAQLVSDIADAPAPLEFVSLKPDAELEADDVGVTLGEIETACDRIELPAEPIVSVVPDVEEPAPQAPDATSSARGFFDSAERFAQARGLIDGGDPQFEGDAALSPDADLLARFMADLTGWNDDSQSELQQPQLIVMRPSGGKGAAVAVVQDQGQTAIAVHDARKLGAVVGLWTKLSGGDS